MHAVTPEDINSANTGSKNQPIFKSHYLAVFLFFGRKKRGCRIERYTISHILTARQSAGGEIKTIWALTHPHVQGQPVLPAMKVGPGHFARMLGMPANSIKLVVPLYLPPGNWLLSLFCLIHLSRMPNVIPLHNDPAVN